MTPSPPQISPPVFRLKAPRQPMLWAAIFYSCGIVAGVYAWRPTLWWIVAAAAFACAAAYFARAALASGMGPSLGALFLAGALHVQTRDAATHLDTSIQPYADRQELQVIAHVTRDGRLQARRIQRNPSDGRSRDRTDSNRDWPDCSSSLRYPPRHLQPPPEQRVAGRFRFRL